MSSKMAPFQYFSPTENSSPFSTNFCSIEDMSWLHLSNFLNNIPNTLDFSPQPSSLSNNSTSDEADEQQNDDIVNERKRRRMISNRESARRSRMRKQKQVDELWSQLVHLRTENQNITEKLNQLAENHEKALEENEQLKEEVCDVRRMLKETEFASGSSNLFS